MLGEIGIGSESERVYLALLREPELGATGRMSDLATEAGVHGAALGGCLDELAAAELIDRDAEVVYRRDPGDARRCLSSPDGRADRDRPA